MRTPSKSHASRPCKFDFQCRVILMRTCVKFPFANKIEEMHERSLVSVEVEPRSTPRLSSALFIPLLRERHPRRPRGSQSGWEKRQDESFQVRAKEPLGTDSHRTISKNSSGCRLLIGHKKCFVLLCPIGEQFLLSSFREFVHDGYCLDHGLSGSCTEEMHAVRKLSV